MSPTPAIVVLLGPPGAGKGTHAEALVARYGLVYIATGDILRAAVAADTELGRQAKSYMSAGHLVPDAVVIGIVRERLAQADVRRQGALLDGFPRTRPQAEALENIVAELGLPAPIVINLEISDQEVVRRLSGRLVCASCAAIFNRERDGLEVGDACPRCGGKLYQRDDDRPEAVRERLRLYYEQTAPLIDFYKQRGLLTSVKVEGGQEEVSQRLVEVVASRLGQ